VGVAFASCNGGSVDLVNQEKQNKEAAKSDESLYHLDLNKTQIEQPVEAGNREVEASKFVQVEVSEVNNPQKNPVKFEVSFQPRDQEKILLGSFSLFPPNNPGKFIVPTQGRVKGEGKIILTLVTSEQAKAGDTLKVAVKRLQFRRE
jgi:hypothetical protein